MVIRGIPIPVWICGRNYHNCVTKFGFDSKHAGSPSPPEDITVSGFDHNNGRGRDDLAQNMARDLDCGNSQGVARILQDIYRNDRRDFANIVRDINRNEQNGRGDDLTITQNGEVYINDCNNGRSRQIRVGRIDDNRGGGRGDDCDPRDRGRDPRDRGRDWDRGGGRGGRDQDCDPRDRGRDWDRGGGGGGRGGRGRVDIDIDIRLPGGGIPIPDCYPDVRPLPYPRDRDCDRPVQRPRYEECDPPVVYRPPYENRRPPYVDRDCNPPVIRRRDRDYEPDYRRSRGGGGGYDQDGEIAGTVIGSVIGGVIGHNNGDRNGRDNTLLGVFAGGALGNVIGREVDRNRNQQNYRWR